MLDSTDGGMSRRDALKAGGLALATACCQGWALQAAEPAGDPYRGFKMGIQSYTLRDFKVNEALEISKKLGLHYWESFPGHIRIATVPKYIADEKEMLSAAGVKLVAFGVVDFGENESKAREVFDFAKGMGIESISANPDKNEATFKLLDKLVAEYAINIAIHNHGPGAKYDKIDDVVNAVKDHHPRIGACVDTGHYLRSKESPVEALERLKDRLFGVHLKDVKNAKVFTILGEGDLDVLGCLKVLNKIKYKYCLALEYEENPQNPVPDIEVCLKNIQAAMAKLT
ncbi:MAG TPA: sugar phosphate isomerase/epimerase [Planctomycetaceae bacterium]|nr:sugar phosphate isomerase/epimerase [Planctomycetaceae bacterium]